MNQRSSTVFDAAGRSIATINALGQRTSFGYDAANQRISLQDANGNHVNFRFDPAGRDVGSIDPLNRRMTFAYDAAGQRTLKLDPRLNRVSYIYDAAGKVTVEQYSDRTRTTYSYDSVGNRTGMVDSVGVTKSVYDSLRRLTSQQPALGGRITYAYDAASRRSWMSNPDTGRFSYSYDAMGRLIQVLNPQIRQTRIIFDAAGQQVGLVHGNGARTSQTFDVAGRLTVQIQTDNFGLTRRTTYGYDPTGRRITSMQTSGLYNTWDYDAAGQLIKESQLVAPTGLPLPLPSPLGGLLGTGYSISYTYDLAGNRLTMADSVRLTSYLYDTANELMVEKGPARITYTYDANGNRTRKDDGTVLTLFDWDVHNRLASAEPTASPISFLYDGDGKRVQKQVGSEITQYLWDLDRVLRESDGSGTLETEYTSTTEQYGHLLSAYGSSSSDYYQFDAQSSAEALLNDSGSVTDRYRYRAFGLATHTQGQTDDARTFIGKQNYQFDMEMGLYLAGARYYDPATGRWLSEDPAGYGPDTNLYRYCQNDPVNNIDPNGKWLFVSERKIEDIKRKLDGYKGHYSVVKFLGKNPAIFIHETFRAAAAQDYKNAIPGFEQSFYHSLAFPYDNSSFIDQTGAIKPITPFPYELEVLRNADKRQQETEQGQIALDRRDADRTVDDIKEQEANYSRQRQDVIARISRDPQTLQTVMREAAKFVNEQRTAFEQTSRKIAGRDLSAQELHDMAPWLYAETLSDNPAYKDFRLQLTLKGDELTFSFGATESLQILQTRQALALSQSLTGNKEEGYKARRIAPFMPPIAAERPAWYARFGKETPANLTARTETPVRGLISDETPLFVLASGGVAGLSALASGTTYSRAALAATADAGINITYTAAFEALEKNLGTAGASAAVIATLLTRKVVKIAPKSVVGKSELGNALSDLGAENAIGRNINRLEEFGQGAGFSGVYDVQSGKFLAYASGETKLANGAVPLNRVKQLGGHDDVNKALSGILEDTSNNRLGFSMVLDAEGNFAVRFNSRTINEVNPNVLDRTVPESMRQQILDAISKATGRKAYSAQ